MPGILGAAADGATADVLSLLESVVTIGAVLLGGVWTYYKFIKDRVYRPRLDILVEGATLAVAGRHAFVCSVSVKNLGTGKIALVTRGTGLRLSTGAPPEKAYERPRWRRRLTVRIFEQHEWIESGETIRDEISLAVPAQPELVLAEIRLVCGLPRGNVSVYARKIMRSGTEPEPAAAARAEE